MGIKVIAKNKRARFDYFLEETLEVGLVLQGTEVKSLREGKVSLAESYIGIDGKKEAWIHNMTIGHYEFGNIHNHDETRKRKLLLHKDQIEKLEHEAKASRQTIVATMIYFKGSRVKLEIALAKGKQQHDKRQDQAKKDVERKLKQRDYS